MVWWGYSMFRFIIYLVLIEDKFSIVSDSSWDSRKHILILIPVWFHSPSFPYPSPRQSHLSPPFLSLCPYNHYHSHLHVRKSSSVAGSGQQPSKPSIPHRPRRSRLWSSVLMLRFGTPLSRLSTAACSPSSTAAPAAWSMVPSAETSTGWCCGFESHASPPSRRRHPCLSLYVVAGGDILKELPRWRRCCWAVKKLGRRWRFGLGLR